MRQQIHIEKTVTVIVRKRRDDRAIRPIQPIRGGPFFKLQRRTPDPVIEQQIDVELIWTVKVADINVKIPVILDIHEHHMHPPAIIPFQPQTLRNIFELQRSRLQEKTIVPHPARRENIGSSIEVNIPDRHTATGHT
jgi:hypothetical protein